MEHIIHLQNIFATSLLFVFLAGLYVVKKYLKDYISDNKMKSAL